MSNETYAAVRRAPSELLARWDRYEDLAEAEKAQFARDLSDWEETLGPEEQASVRAEAFLRFLYAAGDEVGTLASMAAGTKRTDQGQKVGAALVATGIEEYVSRFTQQTDIRDYVRDTSIRSMYYRLTLARDKLIEDQTGQRDRSGLEAQAAQEANTPNPGRHMVLRDQYGELRTLDLDTFKAARDEQQLSEITPDQVRRIQEFKRDLAEHETTSLEAAIANFKRDRTPEREIQVWERIARTYTEELHARPQADSTERAILYRVILACSLSGSAGELQRMVPQSTALSNLDRVVARFNNS